MMYNQVLKDILMKYERKRDNLILEQKKLEKKRFIEKYLKLRP